MFRKHLTILVAAGLMITVACASSMLLTSSPTAYATTTSTSFSATADSYVNQSYPDTNYGTSTTLRMDASPVSWTFLRFSVQNVSGSVTSATLRVYAKSSSSSGLSVAGVSSTSWGETSITYNNAPSAGSVINSVGSYSSGQWVSIDVSSYVTGNGTWSFRLSDMDSTQLALASRETGSTAPQLVVSTGSSTSPTPTPTGSTSSAIPAFDHIFVVVEENKAYNQIVGSSSAPYINSLIGKNGLAAKYYGIRHPSLPNYLAMVGGSTFGITSDCSPSSCPVSATNLADRIEASGRTWKAYMESMPSPCYTSTTGNYVPKHNPFVYFNDIRTNSTRCKAHDVPYTALATDLANASTTPDFVFISPNLCNDMHSCSVGTGDTWLKNQLPKIFNSPAWTMEKSVLFLIWDEDDFTTTNQVAALVIGPSAKAGYRSTTTYNHYSLLHTIESSWGLSALTSNDGGAAKMSDFWR